MGRINASGRDPTPPHSTHCAAMVKSGLWPLTTAAPGRRGVDEIRQGGAKGLKQADGPGQLGTGARHLGIAATTWRPAVSERALTSSLKPLLQAWTPPDMSRPLGEELQGLGLLQVLVAAMRGGMPGQAHCQRPGTMPAPICEAFVNLQGHSWAGHTSDGRVHSIDRAFNSRNKERSGHRQGRPGTPRARTVRLITDSKAGEVLGTPCKSGGGLGRQQTQRAVAPAAEARRLATGSSASPC